MCSVAVTVADVALTCPRLSEEFDLAQSRQGTGGILCCFLGLEDK